MSSESSIVLTRLSVIYILGVSTLIGFIDGKNLMRAVPLASYIPNSVVFWYKAIVFNEALLLPNLYTYDVAVLSRPNSLTV